MRAAQKFAISFAALLAFFSPALGQTSAPWSDFWDNIGGSDDVTQAGGDSVIVRPLRDNADEVVGVRFFRERGSTDPMAATDRGLKAFEQICRTRGGDMVASDDPRSVMFGERVIAHLIRPTGMRHQWRGAVAICDGSDGAPIAGFVSLVKDNSEIHRSGDAGSQLIGGLFGGLRNNTAMYLFRGDRLPSASDATASVRAEQQRIAEVEARMSEARQQAEELQRNLAIGDETNCGTVIDVRGPMAEVAVPANRRTPNGEQTFWSRKERLLPPGHGICTFGL
ncbi:MAG: hypothetical protein WA908_07055 [Pontixanthobacter sp.]